MYKIIISPKAKKQLKSIKLIHKEVLESVIEDLKGDPFFGKPLMRELTGKYSYKVSLYRIIYRVYTKDKIVQIISAGHRSIVYN